MDKLIVLGLLVAGGMMAAGPAAQAATDVRGKVASIAVTSDCPGEGPCAADVRLVTGHDQVGTFHVSPDEEMIRRDKVINLAQLHTGNVVGIPESDEVRASAPTQSDRFLGD